MKEEKILEALKKSKFRNSFHLKEKDKNYIREKGMSKIEEHAREFVSNRLSKEVITNDGKQTPYKGHPVFIAQHATATCCRGCIYKWHKIKKDKELTKEEQDYIVKIIMMWINKEMKE